MYSIQPNIIIGFHGCSKEIGLKVINGEVDLLYSHNDYDWLGDGVYFWENDYERALEFAKETKKEEPFVIGAAIHLGYCLDLTKRQNLQIVKTSYNHLLEDSIKTATENKKGRKDGYHEDIFLRYLDCAVIRAIHKFNTENGYRDYDSVRAAFWEGQPIYQNAGFKEKNHIQICVRNHKSILGYFLPRNL